MICTVSSMPNMKRTATSVRQPGSGYVSGAGSGTCPCWSLIVLCTLSIHSMAAVSTRTWPMNSPRRQHRHPPEKGFRHAINIEPGTRLSVIYGDGEVIVNSEHRRAICRVARNFRISARALDGVIEAIEPENEQWYALGIQWHPASGTASGLDIQLFRGLVDACKEHMEATMQPAKVHAA